MRRVVLVDAMVAIALSMVGQIEVWSMDDPSGPRVVVAAVALAVTASLTLRRCRPLVGTGMVMGALAVSTFAWKIPDKAVFPTVAIVLSVYAVAAYCDVRGAVVGAGFVILPVFGHQLGVQREYSDAVFIAVMIGAVWVAGRGVRAHRERAQLAANHASAVERDSEERRHAAVAEERLRIAREVHDIVAHSVSVMTVQAGAERRSRGADDETNEVLASIEQTGREAMVEMRRLLGVLRAGDDLCLAPQPGTRLIGALAEQMRSAGLAVSWQIEGKPQPLSPGTDLTAYRVVQESLTNTLKHAGTTHSSVTIRYLPDALEIDVVDDGTPSDRAGEPGHGLTGMRERVALYGGSLEAGPAPPRGFAVHVRLPLESDLT